MPNDAISVMRQYYRAKHGHSDWPPDGWDGADFLYAFGRAPEAVVYATLFVPEFIEVEGFVFLRDLGAKPPGGIAGLASQIAMARADSPDALRVFLASCNWLEVPYLFQDTADDDGASEALAPSIVEAWRALLWQTYPDRRFEVSIISPEVTGNTIGIGFVERWGADDPDPA